MNTHTVNQAGRVLYTDQERNELVEEFISSGLSRAEFCRQWQINAKTFGRRVRNQRENDTAHDINANAVFSGLILIGLLRCLFDINIKADEYRDYPARRLSP